MSVLVTGGTGFIGSYVVLDLLERGEVPILFDVRSPEDVPSLRGRGLPWIQGDVRDRDAIGAVVGDPGVRAVIHLAAILQFGCRQDPVQGTEVNILGLLNVLEGARRRGVKRVVTASSAAVYGPFPGRGRGSMDISRARRELGYQPRYSLRDGLREVMKWQRRRGGLA